MAKPQGDVESKLIHLPTKVIQDLTIQAVTSPQKNFKRYAEHKLTEWSKEGKRGKK